jgi:hypothetical protein
MVFRYLAWVVLFAFAVVGYILSILTPQESVHRAGIGKDTATAGEETTSEGGVRARTRPVSTQGVVVDD